MPTEEERRLYEEMRQRLGLSAPAAERGVFSKATQPIRTFFGATQGIGGRALGYLFPEEYERAQEEARRSFGVGATEPWYRQLEAEAGAGDVAAELIPESVRESAVGEALGPVGRMAGNILGDPTTYTPAIMAKAGGAVLRSMPAAARVAEATGAANKALKARQQANALAPDLLRKASLRGQQQVRKAVEGWGGPKAAAWKAAEVIRRGEPYTMGSAAAVAYGPDVLGAIKEGVGQVADAETLTEGVAAGVNTALMSGMAVLMGKGLLSTGQAMRSLSEEAGRKLSVTAGEQDQILRALRGEPEPVPDSALPEATILPEEPPPLPEAEVMSDLDLALAEREPYMPEPVVEGAQVVVPDRMLPEAEIVPEPLPVAEIVPEGPLPVAEIVPETPPEVPVRAPERPVEPIPGEGAAPTIPEFPIDELALAKGRLQEAGVFVPDRVQTEDDLVQFMREAGAGTDEIQSILAGPDIGPGGAAPRAGAEVAPEPAPELRAPAEPTPEAPPVAEPVEGPPPGLLDEAVEKALGSRTDRAKGRMSDEIADRFRQELQEDPALRARLAEAAPEAESFSAFMPAIREEANRIRDQLEREKEVGITTEAGVGRLVEAERAGEGETVDRGEIGPGLGKKPVKARAVQSEKGGKLTKRQAELEKFPNVKAVIEAQGETVQQVLDAYAATKPRLGRGAFSPKREKYLRDTVALMDKGKSQADAIKIVQQRYGGGRTVAEDIKPWLKDFLDKVGRAAGDEAEVAARSAAEPAKGGMATLERLRAKRAEIAEKVPKREEKEGTGTFAKRVVGDDREAFISRLEDDLRVQGEAAIKKLSRQVNIPHAKQLAAELRADPGKRKGLLPHYESIVAKALGKVGASADEIAAAQKRLRDAWHEKQVTPARARTVEVAGRAAPEAPKPVGEAPATFKLAGYEPLKVRGRAQQGTWVGKRGTRIQVAGEGNNVKLTELPKDAAGVQEDLRALLDSDQVALVDVEDVAHPELNRISRELPSGWEVTSVGNDRTAFVRPDRLPKRIETMTPQDFPWTRDAVVQEFEQAVLEAGLELEGELVQRQLRGKLDKLGIKLERDYEVFGTDIEPIGKGTFHPVYAVKGAGPKGEQYIMRIGKAPFLELPTAQQRQYVQQPEGGAGKLLVSGQEWNYTLHRQGYSPKVWFRLDKLAPELRARFGMSLTEAEKDPVTFRAMEDFLRSKEELPPGVNLDDALKDQARLLEGARAAGLAIDDYVYQGNKVKGGNTIYLPLGPNDARTGVLRKGNDGVTYKLVFSDYGSVGPAVPPPGSLWGDLQRAQRLALQSDLPNDALSGPQLARRWLHYEDDVARGIDIGDGRKVVNHDRLAADDYVRRVADTLAAPAQALGRITDDWVKLVNANLEKGMQPITARYAGMTASPHMSGLFSGLEKVGAEGQNEIYTNLVEAAHYAARRGEGYDTALDRILHVLGHELAHNGGKGHDATFQTLNEFIDHLAVMEGKMDEYRNILKEVYTEDMHKQVTRDMVPEYRRQRKQYGESWREPTEGVQGIPPGDTAGRIATEPNRGGRGAQGPPGGRGDGVRPGRPVQRGTGGEAGQLRTAAHAEGGPAPRPAQGEAVRQRAGRGAAEEAGSYPEVVQRVEEFHADGISMESAKREMDALLQNTPRERPINVFLATGWERAEQLMRGMPQSMLDELTEVKPYPRAKGEVEGPLNLTHLEGVPDRLKSKIKLWWELTKDGWERSKPERWEDVDRGVQEMLGLRTPEEWTDFIKKVRRPLKTQDVFILQQVHNDSLVRVAQAEGRFGEAVQAMKDGKIPVDEAKARALHDEMDEAERVFHHVGYQLSKTMTGAGRMLAAGRRAIRASDPRVRWEQDIRAGIRERVATFVKDDKAREAEVDRLYGLLTKAQEAGKDWEEFYKALRALETSKTRKGMNKVLEWYKAGLIGWPSRVANITSNTLFRSVRFAEDMAAATLDWTRSKLTGSERENFIGEAAVGIHAMRKGFVSGGRKWAADFGNALTLGPEDMEELLKRGSIAEDLMHQGGAIQGKFGRFIRFHLRGLSADDVLAKEVSRMDTYYREVYRKVRKGEAFFKAHPGEKAAQAAVRIADDMLDNFHLARDGKQFDKLKLDLFDPIAKKAEEQARGDTFQKDLGSVGRAVQNVLRGPAMPLQFIFPFVRTPTNIFKETIKRTPLGFLEVAAKWDGMSKADQMTALSKPLMGSAIGYLFYNLAMTGEMSGGGPINPDERESLMSLGWQPYSMRFGDEGGGAQWLAYNRLEPVASIMGMAADLAEGARQGDFRNYQAGTERLLKSVAENLTNKTFLSGLDAMLAAASHPKQFLPRFVRQMTGSFVPNSIGFVPFGHLARALDPVYRSTDAFTPSEVAMAKVPFGSKTLDPQYSPTGDVRERPGTFAERLVLPFARRTEEEGPRADAAREIVRLQAAPRAPSREWLSPEGFRVRYTKEERAIMAKALEQATSVVGQRLLKDPSYQRLPDTEMSANYRFGQKTKKDVLENLIRRYRRRALARIKPALKARAREEYKTARREGA